MTTTKPIFIKGKTAKAIYEQMLKQGKGIQWDNVGTENNPVLKVEEWD